MRPSVSFAFASAPFALVICAVPGCSSGTPAPNPAASPTEVVTVDLTKTAPSDPKEAAPAPPAVAGEADTIGMIGVLSEGEQAPAIRGSMWGDSIGDASGTGGLGSGGLGFGGLGLAGTGASAGGASIGLGSIGTIGQGGGGGTGAGFGLGSGGFTQPNHPGPKVQIEAPSAQGGLPKEVIQRVVRMNASKVRYCYEQALRKTPDLEGKLVVGFTIGKDGKTSAVSSTGTITAPDVKTCVEKVVVAMVFPKPDDGVVTVRYPFVFRVEKSTIGSVPAKDATTADVQNALQKGGATSLSKTEKDGVATIALTWEGVPLTVTFAPKSAVAKLSSTEAERLRKSPAVLDEDGVLLAVEGDSAKANRLLDALRK